MQSTCSMFFNVNNFEIGEVVILSCFDRSRELKRAYRTHVVSEFGAFYKGFNLSFNKKILTVITTGSGSSRVGDAILALEGTPCRFVFYTGAAGGLGKRICVGDLIVPERAIIGDGFSRYHKTVFENDLLSNYSLASQCLIERFKSYAESNFSSSQTIFFGDMFTTESLFSETKTFLSELENHDVTAIDMETSAFFTATQKLALNAMAIHYISDLPQKGESPNVFNKNCKKAYVKLPYTLIDFIQRELLNASS